MPTSSNISDLKKRSEIDYIPLFIPLWLSLNAWMTEKFDKVTADRELLIKLKTGDNKLYNKFQGLIESTEEENPIIFKGHLVELYRALENANIPFHRLPKDLQNSPNKNVTFKNTIVWNNGKPKFEDIMKEKSRRDKIKLSKEIYVVNDINKVFGAYIESLYQVRCALFHGDLPLTSENARVIRALYITLQMIMEDV